MAGSEDAFCYLCEKPVAGQRRQVICSDCVGEARRLGVLDAAMSLAAQILAAEKEKL